MPEKPDYKILLHICCGPCSLFPINDLKSFLKDEKYSITGIFYNPNIHPVEEHLKRMEGAVTASLNKGIELIKFDDFDQLKWESFKELGNERCNLCYKMRLMFVAKYAAENGFTHFTTSLLVSPYQNHQLICQTAIMAAEKFGVEFLYRDFRPGFRLGQSEAKTLGIYRQKYCGCILSI